jgi:hypothetical protein
MTCTIVSRHLNFLTKNEVENISNKLENSLVLSVLASPHENLETLLLNIVEKNLSDICIINNEEVRIKRVLSLMKERDLKNERLYFLRLNRVF